MKPHGKPSKQVIWRSLWVTGSGRKKERDEVTTRVVQIRTLINHGIEQMGK